DANLQIDDAFCPDTGRTLLQTCCASGNITCFRTLVFCFGSNINQVSSDQAASSCLQVLNKFCESKKDARKIEQIILELKKKSFDALDSYQQHEKNKNKGLKPKYKHLGYLSIITSPKHCSHLDYSLPIISTFQDRKKLCFAANDFVFSVIVSAQGINYTIKSLVKKQPSHAYNRLIREVNILKMLRNDHIINILGVHVDPDTLLINLLMIPHILDLNYKDRYKFWSAPELLQNSILEIDYRSDIFSFGKLVLELINKSLSFDGFISLIRSSKTPKPVSDPISTNSSYISQNSKKSPTLHKIMYESLFKQCCHPQIEKRIISHKQIIQNIDIAWKRFSQVSPENYVLHSKLSVVEMSPKISHIAAEEVKIDEFSNDQDIVDEEEEFIALKSNSMTHADPSFTCDFKNTGIDRSKSFCTNSRNFNISNINKSGIKKFILRTVDSVCSKIVEKKLSKMKLSRKSNSAPKFQRNSSSKIEKNFSKSNLEQIKNDQTSQSTDDRTTCLQTFSEMTDKPLNTTVCLT
ncbi:MAG: hypothetical protein MHPSP_001044, partial [Paramarteilia canceri]